MKKSCRHFLRTVRQICKCGHKQLASTIVLCVFPHHMMSIWPHAGLHFFKVCQQFLQIYFVVGHNGVYAVLQAFDLGHPRQLVRMPHLLFSPWQLQSKTQTKKQVIHLNHNTHWLHRFAHLDVSSGCLQPHGTIPLAVGTVIFSSDVRLVDVVGCHQLMELCLDFIHPLMYVFPSKDHHNMTNGRQLNTFVRYSIF